MSIDQEDWNTGSVKEHHERSTDVTSLSSLDTVDRYQYMSINQEEWNTGSCTCRPYGSRVVVSSMFSFVARAVGSVFELCSTLRCHSILLTNIEVSKLWTGYLVGNEAVMRASARV